MEDESEKRIKENISKAADIGRQMSELLIKENSFVVFGALYLSKKVIIEAFKLEKRKNGKDFTDEDVSRIESMFERLYDATKKARKAGESNDKKTP